MRSTFIEIHELVRVSTKLSLSLCIVAAERAARERETERDSYANVCGMQGAVASEITNTVDGNGGCCGSCFEIY